MKKFLYLFLLLFSLNSFAQNTIEDYQRIFLPVYTIVGDLKIAIRVFKINGTPSFLTVNPKTLDTEILPIASLRPRQLTPQKKKPGYFTFWNIASTPYYQILNKNTAEPYVMENQGLKHVDLDEGNILTVDLCPSSKPFEADFFKALVKRADELHKPTPLVIAVSGMWIIGHPDEFQWLISQEKQHKLDITWANHSFSHVYYNDLPYADNFLLRPETNFDLEILQTEKYLLEAGEMPSIFFRFPGLISNPALIKKLKSFGLIPLGTDAWIANLKRNRQEVMPGGIILVHGNSNEHKGIVLIKPLLDKLDFKNIKNALL
ncbi:hypothetical protein ACNVED_09865 [Legionella sp. D16C41]|uniref:hypothetical protein n=1 Tax=Legionella sp. D16C41 TaxID=3402688 RepID=UPI003AF5813B